MVRRLSKRLKRCVYAEEGRKEQKLIKQLLTKTGGLVFQERRQIEEQSD